MIRASTATANGIRSKATCEKSGLFNEITGVMSFAGILLRRPGFFVPEERGTQVALLDMAGCRTHAKAKPFPPVLAGPTTCYSRVWVTGAEKTITFLGKWGSFCACLPASRHVTSARSSESQGEGRFEERVLPLHCVAAKEEITSSRRCWLEWPNERERPNPSSRCPSSRYLSSRHRRHNQPSGPSPIAKPMQSFSSFPP